MKIKTLLVVAVTLWRPTALPLAAAPLATAFTYQGRLSDGGNPASGQFDLRFQLYDAETSGAALGSAVTSGNVSVDSGVFTTQLDFGAGAFDGSAHWLQIDVRPAGVGDFVPLTPRQPLSAAPYALFAAAGNPGPQGSQGAKGDKGDKGDVGATGSQGLKGDTGATGAAGATGAQGPAGAKGDVGATGAAGPQGSAGAKGDTGLMGSQGPTGAAGAQGPKGDTGVAGTQGPRGVTFRGAWSVAVNYPADDAVSYNGSSWIAKQPSLNVAPAENSVWTLLAQQGGTGATGPQGAAGPKGDTGLTGAQGLVGPAGAQGAKGDPGNTGATGPQGPIGLTGATGAQGPLGPQGPQGIPGSVDGWSRTGNAGTTAGANFFGTTDNQALEFKVNNVRALRLEPTTGIPNLVGGSSGNRAFVGVVGAVIAGGGDGQFDNVVTDDYGTIGGGANNSTGDSAGSTSDAIYATVGGGKKNTSGAYVATVGGGIENISSGNGATVGGGGGNTSSGSGATVGGGAGNTSSGISATVGGGYENISSGGGATVGGGSYNTGSGVDATVPGGQQNVASGVSSLAAGQFAKAVHDRSFIWSSYGLSAPTFGADTFFVSAPNGIGINCGAQRVDGGGQFWLNLGNVTGSDLIETSVGAHLTTSGVWANASDKNRKTDFAPVSSSGILEKLAALPVRQWRYTNEVSGVKHLGPTAQDFKSAFGLGVDDKSIGTVDEEGVALAAIQGLNQKLEEKLAAEEAASRLKDTRIAALERSVAELKSLVSGLVLAKGAAMGADAAGVGSQISRRTTSSAE